MSEVFVVMTSNCEDYEDYYTSINSIWRSREEAVNHIETVLKMKQDSVFDPSKKHSRDHWIRDFPEYPKKEEFEGDPEGWADCFDAEGNLIPYWVSHQDAWILTFPLNE